MNKPPLLKLSTLSNKSIEMLAGALALSALPWDQQTAVRRRAEEMLVILRKMGGSRR